jgi:hypothetical protein
MKGSYCVIFLLLGCQNIFTEKSGLVFKEVEVRPLKASTVYFEELKAQVLRPYCIECHGEYSQYDTVKKNADEILKSVENGSMPKDAKNLDNRLIYLIEDWITTGKMKSPNSNPVEIPADNRVVLEPTFSSITTNIFEPKCNRCHNEDDYISLIDTTDLDAMRAVKDFAMEDIDNPYMSTFIQAIYGEKRNMPPKKTKLEYLTKEEVDIIIEWYRLDLPE